MGQRLVINIYDERVTSESDPIANIYYHWSGYTESAVEEIAYLYDALTERLPYGTTDLKELQRVLGDIVIEKGGFVERDDEDYAKNELGLQVSDAGSRNEGIIAFREDAMSNLEYWAESTATLDLANHTFDLFGLFFPIIDLDEFIEAFSDLFPERQREIKGFKNNKDLVNHIIKAMSERLGHIEGRVNIPIATLDTVRKTVRQASRNQYLVYVDGEDYPVQGIIA